MHSSQISKKQFTFVPYVEGISGMSSTVVKYCSLIFFFLFACAVFAQQEEPAQLDSSQYFVTGEPLSNKDSLKFYERRLISLSESIITAREQTQRYTSTYNFARTLINALKIPNSFDYPFDSVKKYISIITPPDKKFRIFTWSLKHGKDSLVTADSFEFYGAIQMNNKEKLELYGLYDKSAITGKAEYSELGNRNWYGALYYQMAVTKYRRKRYYTLLGWDGHDMSSNRKVIDVLWFDEMGKPRFGAPIFDMADKKKPKYRVVFEFRNDAVMTLRYIKKKKLIAFENLIPPSPNAKGMYTQYLPDGSYDYFKFKRGKWHKKELLFENVRNIPMDAFDPSGPKSPR
jgi:hypothetical protein